MRFLLTVVTMIVCCSAGTQMSQAVAVEQISFRNVNALTTPDNEDEFPAIGCDAQGRIWVAWVSYDGEDDCLLATCQTDHGWSDPVRMADTSGDHWRPALGRDGDGRLWLTWAQNVEGNWDVWGRFHQKDIWSKPLRLTNGTGSDISQKLAADSTGRLWMTWQSVVDRNYEVLLARVTPSGLADVRNVSCHSASDWEPAIAAGRDGEISVAWDSYRNGSYDVLLRSFKDGSLGPVRGIATSPAYEAHATITTDREGRIWIAWDKACSNWGRHGDSRRRLHSERSVELRCLESDRICTPKQPLSECLKGEYARFCELPQLIVDDTGRLWLFVRHLRDLTPPGRRPNGRPYQARGIWNPCALSYSNGQWSEPLPLPDSNGRNDMRLAMCLDNTGRVWTAWADDQRKESRAEEPVNHNVHVASLGVAGAGASRLPIGSPEQTAVVLPAESEKRQEQERHRITAAGKDYMLLFGDTHRHTDISRCAMNYDGSLLDTYRYAIDAAGLDFLAISDHDQDLLKHRYEHKQSPLQAYAWWRSQKYCDLFCIADRFLTLYGYEHGGSFAKRGGHKNVIYSERGHPCYEQDSPEELFHLLQDVDAIAVPHQLADGGSATDWSKWNPEFERVAEIFQARGSYEFFGAPPGVRVQRKGYYLWDALEKGVEIGVIASSDHGLVHGAYAAVYATDFSRKAVLEALRERRSFGATDTIVLDFRLGDVTVGQRAEVTGPPVFDVFVRGVEPLTQVQVVKDNQFVYTTKPNGSECQFRYTDTELAAGQSAYYYVRCQQEETDWAWSSAIWVERP